ncbi:MAG TPA: signal peptidase I [Acidimicrobiales bacterium]|nr:signal peptidase I [Acidimicrobiales bacterium]
MAIEDDPVLSEAARRPAPAVTEKEEKARPSGVRNAVEWVGIAGGALLIAFLIKTFLLQAFYIPSLSMDPTLKINDRVLVNKLSYDLHDVNRGDIVVFESPPHETSENKDLIKRVIGLPGETVEAHDGRIFIDGQVLDEPYLEPHVQTNGPICRDEALAGCDGADKIVVPVDAYFVLGDNRPNSRDSRFIGAIPESLIIGRAFVRVWPVTALGLL